MHSKIKLKKQELLKRNDVSIFGDSNLNRVMIDLESQILFLSYLFYIKSAIKVSYCNPN